MGKLVLTDASVVLNGVDLSVYVKSISLPQERELKDSTGMGLTSRTYLPGMKDNKATIEFFQDYDAAKVDATLQALFDAPAGQTLVAKPTSGAVSATNPSYTGTVMLPSYNPIDGAVGDVEMTSVSLQVSGDLTKAVA